MDKELEKAFMRAINKVIGSKEAFMETLLENIRIGLVEIKSEFTREQLDEKVSKLQEEQMKLVRQNAKMITDTREYENDYNILAVEIDRVQALQKALLDEEAKKIMQGKRMDDLKEFLNTQETLLERFDEELFHRLIEKVSIISMVEVMFVFKTGVEVREVLRE